MSYVRRPVSLRHMNHGASARNGYFIGFMGFFVKHTYIWLNVKNIIKLYTAMPSLL